MATASSSSGETESLLGSVRSESQDWEAEETERGRGRGRGGSRGRGRSRGRGGSRGRSGGRPRSRGSGSRGGRSRSRGEERPEERRDETALSNINQRQEKLMEEVSTMTDEERKHLLCRLVENYPQLILDILRPAARQPGGYHPGPGQALPDWCVCGHCREMPTAVERQCCGKVSCVTLLPDFQVLILDEAVLALARLYRRDILVFDDEADVRKANRHQAYRQFILWTFGRLTVGDRRVVPSCSVWKIRDKFPDPFGQYTGFKPSRLG